MAQLRRWLCRCDRCGRYFTKVDDDEQRCLCGGAFVVDAKYHPLHPCGRVFTRPPHAASPLDPSGVIRMPIVHAPINGNGRVLADELNPACTTCGDVGYFVVATFAEGTHPGRPVTPTRKLACPDCWRGEALEAGHR